MNRRVNSDSEKHSFSQISSNRVKPNDVNRNEGSNHFYYIYNNLIVFLFIQIVNLVHPVSSNRQEEEDIDFEYESENEAELDLDEDIEFDEPENVPEMAEESATAISVARLLSCIFK